MVYDFKQWVGKEVFVSFKEDDDDERIKSGYFILLEVNQNFVAIKTQKNSGIIIPISQLLKIKLKNMDQNV